MKKIIIYLFSCFCLFSCSSYKSVDFFHEEKIEAGSCYHSFIMKNTANKTNLEKAFILEITEPVFKKIEKKYSAKELEKILNDKDEFIINTKKAGYRFIFKNDDLHFYTSDKNQIGFMICKVEVPPEFRFFQKKDLHQYKNGVTVTFKKLIQPTQIKKKYFYRKLKTLSNSQLYFPRGNWTELKVANRGSVCSAGTIRIVQRQLRNLGYDLKVDNILDEKTRAALLDFQQKNDLKTGQLDIKTLEALGVKY